MAALELWPLAVGSTLAVLGLILMWSARRKATRSLDRVVELVAQFQSRKMVGSTADLETELARARRYERPFAVLAVTLARDAGTSGSVLPQGALTLPLLGVWLRENLRETDCIAYGPTLDCYLLGLFEVTREQAEAFQLRLEESAASSPLTLRCGIAHFPGDGYILADLIRLATERCGAAATLRPVAVATFDTKNARRA